MTQMDPLGHENPPQVKIGKEKFLIAFWSITLTRSHIIWTSWCHMKAMMYGYILRVKKWTFYWVLVV